MTSRSSQFGIASVTKSIIAAQVIQVVEAGQVALDAPASEELPANFGFDTNGATIRRLLSHRSGISDWYGDAMEERLAADRSRVWELDEILALVDAARRPVGAHEYSDTNYKLLGLVIEHVRKRPLVERAKQPQSGGPKSPRCPAGKPGSLGEHLDKRRIDPSPSHAPIRRSLWRRAMQRSSCLPWA